VGRFSFRIPDLTFAIPPGYCKIFRRIHGRKHRRITDSNFESEVVKSTTPVLVDFWAAWCAPCRALAPTIDSIAVEYKGRVKVGKLDVDANGSTAATLQYSRYSNAAGHQGRPSERTDCRRCRQKASSPKLSINTLTKMNLAVVGMQWGDEGKGKIVDILSEEFDCVTRYQGGHNAGHTVSFGNRRHVLHLIPSGIFQPKVTCVVGCGVVLDPLALIEESQAMEQVMSIHTEGRLFVSNRCHLILPYHRVLEAAIEKHSASAASARPPAVSVPHTKTKWDDAAFGYAIDESGDTPGKDCRTRGRKEPHARSAKVPPDD